MRHEPCVFHAEGTMRFSSNKDNIKKLTRQIQRKTTCSSCTEAVLLNAAPYSLDLRWRIIELHFVENIA